MALSGGIFDFDAKTRRLSEVREALQDPSVWNDPARAQALGKEQSDLEAVVARIEKIDRSLDDSVGLLELAEEENDEYYLTVIAIICEETLRLGGSIVHPHGIGKARARWVEQEYGSSFPMLVALKQAFDPNKIMNMGTIIPTERL